MTKEVLKQQQPFVIILILDQNIILNTKEICAPIIIGGFQGPLVLVIFLFFNHF